MNSATPVSHWGNNELAAYRIVIEDTSALEFFETLSLRNSPHSGMAVWDIEKQPPNSGVLSELESDFFFYMKTVEESDSLESATLDFAHCLLRILGFANKEQKVRHRPPLHFKMCGVGIDSYADIALVAGKSYMLLVQWDKLRRGSEHPEAQLIAKSIAAIHENQERLRRLGRPISNLREMLGMTMVGTAPIFYRIPVSKKLLQALETGSRPDEETIVQRCIPAVPDLDDYLTLGMRPLENRHIILEHFEAFRKFLSSEDRC